MYRHLAQLIYSLGGSRMNSRPRSFLYCSTVACLLLAIAPSCIKTQQCSPAYYYSSGAGPPLPPSITISNHTVNIAAECHKHCTKEEKCFGFNYRAKESTENTVNCQLSNSTEKWNRTETGVWVHYQDVRVIEDIDECSQDSNKCGSNGDCIHTPGSYDCQCHNGYKNEGKNCTDIDECSSGNHKCDPSATCTNNEGSYQCQCNSGYTGDGNNCTDIDECSNGNHKCDPSATCTNTEGSYQCQCNSGYTGDGHNCTDIDECSSGTHTCNPSATCNNTESSYQCQCNSGYAGDGHTCTVMSCAKSFKEHGVRKDGVYTIDPDGLGSFQVWCDMATDGGGWTVFQRRVDATVDFYRGWHDYKTGFGDFSGNFWLGLDKIHRLTNSGQDVLRVDLMDFDNTTAYAEYESFGVSDEAGSYTLSVGRYSGNAGDSLAYHNGMKFSTKDRDNDMWTSESCAFQRNKGGWWYNSCQHSNLNGRYLKKGQVTDEGINWYYWKNDYRSLKEAEMKTRPVQS